MTNIGTPDWQYGVVSAGMLLASEPGTSASVTVAIPPNAKTLFVFALPGNDWKGLRCVGATTGVEYPGVQRLLTFNITSNYCVLFDVASQVDSSVIITWALQPSEQWYVYSSSSTHVVDVPELAAMAQEPNVPPVNFGILAIGSDGTDARILSTDSSGKLQVVIANMPNPATTVTGPDAYGDPAVVGVSADYARGDHDHGLPAASASGPLSVTQYGPTTDPAYAISTTAMTAVDTTNLTTSSFTVPASGKIKVTVSGVIIFGNTYLLYLSMLDHSTHSQVGDTVAASNGFAASWPVAFTKTYIISGLGAGSKQLDLAMYTTNTATSLHALVSATPAKNDYGPITILIEAA